MYRTLVAALFLACALACAADAPATLYPLWDGQESVTEYAKRVNLPPTKTLDLGNDVKLELVLIPAGKFIMGVPERESPWIGGTIAGIAVLIVLVLAACLLWRAFREHRRPQFSLRWLLAVVLILGVAQYGGFRYRRALTAPRSLIYESPAHVVTLTKAFYMGKLEVTQEQYEQAMGEKPRNFEAADLPFQSPMHDWNEAAAVCEKISEKTGQAVRLPTEAEWEFACRAGTTTTYYTGDTEADLARAAWYGENAHCTTHPGGQREPNAFGLYDMLGNVAEWCLDRWQERYDPEPAVDPQGPPKGEHHVLRGGSLDFDPWFCRATLRDHVGGLYCRFGLRVVVPAPR